MKSVLDELRRPESLRGRIVIDIAPSPGMVGLLIANLMIESMNAEKIAELYSPHFPQISLVNNEGIASLPRVEVYEVRPSDGGAQGLVLLTRNFLVDTNEAGEEAAHLIYEYLAGKEAGPLLIITSGRISGSGDVYVASSGLGLNRPLIQLGAKSSPTLEMLPMDKLSSFLILNYHLDSKPTQLLICDTQSYMPDFAAAKKVLTLLSKHLKIGIDLSRLDREMERQSKLMEELERGMIDEARDRSESGPSYIG